MTKIKYDFEQVNTPFEMENILEKHAELVANTTASFLDWYVTLHVNAKPRRMKQENWEKMCKKVLVMTHFHKPLQAFNNVNK